MSTLILALDVGTSSLRTMLYDTQANEVAGSEVQIAHSARTTPDGGVELDPALLFANTLKAIDGALAHVPKGDTVAAVATDTLWHSMLGVDADGAPLTPLYTWADTRAATAPRRSCAAGSTRKPSTRAPAACCTPRISRPSCCGSAKRSRTYGGVPRSGSRSVNTCSCACSAGPSARSRWPRAPGCSTSTVARGTRRCSAPSASTPRDSRRWATRATRWAGLSSRVGARWPALAGVPWFPALGDGACSNIGSGCTTPRALR